MAIKDLQYFMMGMAGLHTLTGQVVDKMYQGYRQEAAWRPAPREDSAEVAHHRQETAAAAVDILVVVVEDGRAAVRALLKAVVAAVAHFV
jgi:hypothetical protein